MPRAPCSFSGFLPRKLSDKVLAICAVITVAQVVTAAALYYSSERSAEADRVVVESKIAQVQIERMNRLILAIVMDSRGMYAQSTYAAAEPFAKTMLKSIGELEEVTRRTRAAMTPDALPGYDLAAKKIDDYIVFRHEFLKLCRESWMPACKDFSDNEVNRKARRDLNAAIDQVGEKLGQHAAAADDAMETWRWRMRVLLTLAIAGAVAGMVGSLSLIVTHVKRPFGAIIDSVRALSRGDLRAEIYGAARGDEIGEIARSLAAFRDGLQMAEGGRARSEAERAEAEARRSEAQAQRAAAEEKQLRSERERAAATEDAVRHERQLVSTQFGGVIAALSQKDLQRRMTDAVPEAYAVLQRDFNNAIDAIEAAIGAVVVSARALASGSEEIAGASNDLSRRTEHQASNLEEIAATFVAMNEKVAQTAQGALVARDAVASASATAREGEDIARATIAAMQKIEKSSTQITAILSLINEISFQTNLLALNAGVEAARAGEAGRGFSVVATEVRALAVRSATAAREIEALIAQASAEVAEGGKLVLRSGEAFVAIQAAIDNGREIVAKIADRAQEQSNGLREINGALQQLETMTQQNAAMAEQATAASRSLSSEAVKLARLTGDFKTGARRQPRRGGQGADERAA